MNGIKIKYTKAKMWVAAAGSIVTSIMAVLATISLALGDDAINTEEVAAILGTLAALYTTIQGVYSTENKIIPDVNTPTVRGRV